MKKALALLLLAAVCLSLHAQDRKDYHYYVAQAWQEVDVNLNIEAAKCYADTALALMSFTEPDACPLLSELLAAEERILDYDAVRRIDSAFSAHPEWRGQAAYHAASAQLARLSSHPDAYEARLEAATHFFDSVLTPLPSYPEDDELLRLTARFIDNISELRRSDIAIHFSEMLCRSYHRYLRRNAPQSVTGISKQLFDYALQHYVTHLSTLASLQDLGNHSGIALDSLHNGMASLDAIGVPHSDIHYVDLLIEMANVLIDKGSCSEAGRLANEAVSYLDADNPDHLMRLYKTQLILSFHYGTSAEDAHAHHRWDECRRYAALALPNYEGVARILEMMVEPDNGNLLGWKAFEATLHTFLGDTLRAREMMRDIRLTIDSSPRFNDMSRAFTYLKIASSYARMGMFDSVQAMVDPWMSRYGTYEPHNPTDLLILANAADGYHFAGRHAEASRAMHGMVACLKRLLRTQFLENDEQGREDYWRLYSISFADVPCYAYRDPAACGDAFDFALLSKGVLLSSTIEFANLILQSGDSALIADFQELSAVNHQMAAEEGEPVSDSLYHALSRRADQLDRQLRQRSQAYGDYTRYIDIDWHDVQQHLANDAAAIEFVTFYPDDRSDLSYAALLLRPGMSRPEMVVLCTDRQLDNVVRTQGRRARDVAAYLNTPELYHLLWHPLEGRLKGVKNIYFSPDGALYQLPIEQALVKGRKRMSDCYSMYRLSSTRQLALSAPTIANTRAALYGGIKYDTSYHKPQREVRNDHSHDYSRGITVLPNHIVWNELDATRQEVDSIAAHLRQRGVDPATYSAVDATERSFKDLSGQHTAILHIATHGFFFPDTNPEAVYHPDGSAMTRTALLFAGAQSTFNGGDYALEEDDGILTAREISHLNLRGTDMVVMSACQTGLGELTVDGISGLQRGFKKAGANSIVASLWEVSDEATCMLMGKFYEYLAAGDSKQQAMLKAQRYVRTNGGLTATDDDTRGGSKYSKAHTVQREQARAQQAGSSAKVPAPLLRDFSDPFYWAGFVLIDALR